MTSFSFGSSHSNRDMLKDGKPFFRSPIANGCHGSLRVGLTMPEKEAIDSKRWYSDTCAVVVAGGSCCHGYLMGLTDDGGIEKILELDFNVYRIIPLICRESRFSFLVSGAGCDGMGVRVVNFEVRTMPTCNHVVTPTATPIVTSEECVKAQTFHFWSGNPNPLECVPDIWERLAAKGFTADREMTLQVQPLFESFGCR